MEKEFIPYAEALTLKELGFDKPCLAMFDEYKIFEYNSILHNANILIDCVSAPLYQQAFRWFREKYGLYSHIGKCMGMKAESYFVEINTITEMLGIYDSEDEQVIFKSYSEAELECLKKLIEIVKEKK